jgi:hypothetical protein
MDAPESPASQDAALSNLLSAAIGTPETSAPVSSSQAAQPPHVSPADVGQRFELPGCYLRLGSYWVYTASEDLEQAAHGRHCSPAGQRKRAVNHFLRYSGLHIVGFMVHCILVVLCLADEKYMLSALFGAAAICSAALGRISWNDYRASIGIQPAPIMRDADGYWTHPEFPSFDEGQSADASAWFKSQRLETRIAYLESEADDHPACVSYWGDKDPGIDISAWKPPKPKGWGWFILSIHDTEDWGPVCVWVRRKAEQGNGAER